MPLRHFFLVLALLCGLRVSASGQATPAPPSPVPAELLGVYYHENAPTESLELKADGTFAGLEEGTRFTGTYTIEGKEIVLQTTGGKTAKGKIDGEALIDPKGDRWSKKR